VTTEYSSSPVMYSTESTPADAGAYTTVVMVHTPLEVGNASLELPSPRQNLRHLHEGSVLRGAYRLACLFDGRWKGQTYCA
jgi:hypothetical protein